MAKREAYWVGFVRWREVSNISKSYEVPKVVKNMNSGKAVRLDETPVVFLKKSEVVSYS